MQAQLLPVSPLLASMDDIWYHLWYQVLLMWYQELMISWVYHRYRIPDELSFKSWEIRMLMSLRWGYLFSVPVYYLLEHSLSQFQMWAFHFAFNTTFSSGFQYWLGGFKIRFKFSSYTVIGSSAKHTGSLVETIQNMIY